ncbi:MAG: TIGR01906 family membrane protein [Clostridiales bacterium]|nr:TIGR01906 family membrane protein [Clostridiales bacterium]
MKNEILAKLSKYCIMIFLPIAIFLLMLQTFAFNVEFYMSKFDEFETTEIIKIDEANLKSITVNMIDYLQSERDDLEMLSVINGRMEEVFGEREKEHMKDVKLLFDNGIIIRNVSVIITLASLIYLFFKNKSNVIFSAILKSSIVSLGLISILLALVKIDFFKYFTYFHEIFFTNDLWLLDPKTDVLIQMLPLEFFISISTSVVLWFSAIMLFSTLLSLYKVKKQKIKSS